MILKKKMKVIATIEARMGSSRLPGKVMKKLGKYYLLEILIKRLKKSKLLDDIVVATTKNVKDDKIVNFLIKNKINFSFKKPVYENDKLVYICKVEKVIKTFNLVLLKLFIKKIR